MTHPNSFRQVQLVGTVLLLAVGLTLSSCTDPIEQPSDLSDSVSKVEVPEVSPPPATGELSDDRELSTEVKTAVLQDAATRYSVAAADLEIVMARAESWPNGCLGLGGPDDICTLAMVDGWEVTVAQGEQRWVYRTDLDGTVVKPANELEN